MDYLTFISEMTKSLSWPIVILVIILNFKADVLRLLLRISKVKYKDTEIIFYEGVKKLKDEITERGQKIHPPDKSNPLRGQYEMLKSLAEILRVMQY